jgi:hypothetical protein
MLGFILERPRRGYYFHDWIGKEVMIITTAQRNAHLACREFESTGEPF